MLHLHVIASGSKGNCSVIYDDKTTLLVDCGISKRRLINGLKEINKSIEDVEAIFFTHEHSDHISNQNIFDDNLKYSTFGTIESEESNIMEDYETYTFNTIKVTVLKTSHDAFNPCGFLFKSNKEELVYITDTGYIPEDTLKLINNKTYYYFESNHDVDMLFNSGRPQYLINRIYGDEGHLSNIDSAKYLALAIGNKTKGIVLAHLSEECNTEKKALSTLYNVFNDLGISYNGISIKCAKQRKSVDL